MPSVCRWPCGAGPTGEPFPTWFKAWSEKRAACVAERVAADDDEARLEAIDRALSRMLEEVRRQKSLLSKEPSDNSGEGANG